MSVPGQKDWPRRHPSHRGGGRRLLSLSAIAVGLALGAFGLIAPAASASTTLLQHNSDTVTVSWEMPEGGSATNILYPQLELSPKLNPDAVQCGRTIQTDVYYYKTKDQKKTVDALIDGKVLDNRQGHSPSDYTVIKSWSFSQEPACQTTTTTTTPTSSTVTTPTTTVVTTATTTATETETVTTASTATRTATETVTTTSPVVVTITSPVVVTTTAPPTTVTTTLKPPVVSTPPVVTTTSKSTLVPATSTTYHPGPGNTGDGGAMPTSGSGPNVPLLVAGILLLLGGSLGFVSSRRRRSGARA